jgi:trans-aconitate methyltransferase
MLMPAFNRLAHWQQVYTDKDEQKVSWFEAVPQVSLELIRATGAGRDAAIVDIGGGASRLVDALLDDGFSDVTVLDVARQGLAKAQARLGARANRVHWLTADATIWQPQRSYDVWHDRAALHFLTAPEERAAYFERLNRAVMPGGHVILATFAPDGPDRCSGLPVLRYDPTPAGTIQRFQFSRFCRVR